MNQISDMSAVIDGRIIEYLVQRFEVNQLKNGYTILARDA